MEIDKAIRESDDTRLKTKYNNAIYVIQRALALYSVEEVAFSFNGGKDSTVLLHLLRAGYYLHNAGKKLSSGDTEGAEITFPIRTIYFESPSTFPEINSFTYETASMDISRQDFKSGLEALFNAKPIRAIFLGVRIGDPTVVCRARAVLPELTWMAAFHESESHLGLVIQVFIYGGVGPLPSDVTIAGVAKAFGVDGPDEEFEEYLRHLIGEKCTGDRNEMAQLPEGITELLHHEKLGVPLCQNVIIFTATNVAELEKEWDCLIELMRSMGFCNRRTIFFQRDWQQLFRTAYRESRGGSLIITFEGKEALQIKDHLFQVVDHLVFKVSPVHRQSFHHLLIAMANGKFSYFISNDRQSCYD
ncbi:hypothetical protein DH2020_014998 [Rehmannia glutinosa]|uniref:FAD synthase n=1 Tax=Rehmannia glutinosa TaxID=99300 RepID=A0ABR0WY26_REHGL